MSTRFRAHAKHGARPARAAPKARRRPHGSSPAAEAAIGGAERLQKVLAAAGIGSRRKCEELISAGRVTVDGRMVSELGTKVDPDEAEIRIDGEPLPRTKRLYYMVNKPHGVVSTNRDPAGRPRVIDLLPSAERLFTVGRLDLSSEGLILATNDGELANLLAHPRYGVEKTYHAQVVGVPEADVLDRLRQGVHLAEGFAHAKRVSIKSHHKQSATLEIVLDEGRNREVRRLLARVGHKVLRLKRIALGPLRLGDLGPGEFRPLRREEVRALREVARESMRAGGASAPAGKSVTPSAPVEAGSFNPELAATGGAVAAGSGINKASPMTPRRPPPPGRRQRFAAARRREPRR
jgi:23S rRNA pseudouridine2605 synthase